MHDILPGWLRIKLSVQAGGKEGKREIKRKKKIEKGEREAVKCREREPERQTK